MTSQVNPNNIDGTYPVAGQDNDSQGFRDNFTNIRNNFVFIKAEVEDLQNKAVLKSALSNTTLDNNFAGNAISNPSLTSWRETYNNIGSVSGSITVNFANGNFQKITMTGSTTLAFTFPSNTTNQYASIKLWVSNPNASYTLTLPAACTLGDPDTIPGLSGSPPVITFSAAEIANNTDYFFEFFTFNAGTTIGIRDLIRNRDVDLSGLSITGNLAIDGLTVSTYNSTFNSNLTVGGNLFVTSGNIGTSDSTANLFNVLQSTISLGNAATNIFMGISSGNVKVAGNLLTSANSYSSSFVPTSTAIPAYGIYTPGTNQIGFSTNFTPNWLINASGTLLPQTDSTFDIGNGTVNPRDITASRYIISKGNLIAAANATVSGNLITTGGRINSNYAYVTLTNNQNFFANATTTLLFFDTASSATIANARIALPAGAEDGREISINVLAPITALWINKANTADVRWSPNAVASSGNVALKFIWSQANSNWLRSS